MTEQEFVDMLSEMVTDSEEFGDDVAQVDSFEEQGLMTANKGLVVFMQDGSAFQVQVVQSAAAR